MVRKKDTSGGDLSLFLFFSLFGKGEPHPEIKMSQMHRDVNKKSLNVLNLQEIKWFWVKRKASFKT